MQSIFSEKHLDKICLAMEDNLYIAALRRGLSLSIPFFLFGSVALILMNLPIVSYQEFLYGIFGSRLVQIFFWMYAATMGMLSLVLIISVSHSFGRLADSAYSGFYPLTCLVSYIIFIMEPNGELSFSIFTNNSFGPNWLFTAVLVTLSACALLRILIRTSQHWHNKHYHEGIDLDFQNVMVSLFPITAVILSFILIKVLLNSLLGTLDLQNVGSVMFTSLFEKVGTGFWGAVLFIFLIHILWFFGIHGSNMLAMVSDGMFELGMEENMIAAGAGEEIPHLFTKTFFDSFILMGGSGATICLLIALLLGTKRSNSKSLFKFSIIPSIFNVNELVLFGLPVVFNPIMLIPFLLVPLVVLCTSSAAMAIGLVPFCSQQVQWTVPVLFSGWLSTGSWTGALLQIVNIIIGTIIYLPFIKMSERYYSGLLKRNVNHLRDVIIEREATGNTTSLHSTAYQNLHEVIKLLTADLRYAMHNRKISLYYQPQFRKDGTLYGVEALLRWNHPNLGLLYPPMVVELAREEGLLQKMGYQIIETAACALERLSKEVNYPIHMAVNISPIQLEDPTFCSRVEKMMAQHNFKDCTLCFEITEQIALSSTHVIHERIATLHNMGIPFHMDDFGMGHSSILYLQNNDFSAVKLDGSLVKDMMQNKRSQEIIGGIHRMSSSLNYDLIAEYVETTEQKDTLGTLGCDIYQGYLYSPAIPLPELESFMLEHQVISAVSEEERTVQELYL